jgi:GT2 family glycosyltransferase
MSETRRLYPQELLKVAQAERTHESGRVGEALTLPSVTIAILSLDRVYLTRRCVESIYAHSDYPFDLLIWDNGSQPETVTFLRTLEETHDNLRVIYHPTNIGPARGRNHAFAEAPTDYVFSLDNDIICHAGWLSETMACATRHNAAFVAPMRLDVEGLVWALGPELVGSGEEAVVEIARWFHGLPVAYVQQIFDGCDTTTNFISGGAGLYAVDAFQACKGFKEVFEVGFEDIEFSLQLEAMGYTVWATPRAMVTHDDEWQPQTEADVDYVRVRYDMGTLRRDAVRFKELWNLEVLPDKYVRAFKTRARRKLDPSK